MRNRGGACVLLFLSFITAETFFSQKIGLWGSFLFLLIVFVVGFVNYKFVLLLLMSWFGKKRRLGEYLGKGWFAQKTHQSEYLWYTLVAHCNYTGCDGIVFVSDPPAREKDNHRFIGCCSVDQKKHTYEIDENGVGRKKTIDWRLPEKKINP